MTPRGPDGTLQRRVFLALRRLGPSTAQQLADDMGLDREGVRKAIYYLALRGKASKQRRGARAMYYTALGTHAPKDMRGKPPGCRNRAKNLGPSLLAANRARLKNPNWLPKPKADSHPLSLALGRAQ